MEEGKNEKKREMGTYKKLGLSREAKSKFRREKVADERLYIYIGEGTDDRPHLKVLRSEYLRVRKKIQAKIRKELENLKGNQGALADMEKRMVENKVYDELAVREYQVKKLEESFEKKHGRHMTPHEKSVYSKALDDEMVKGDFYKVRKERADAARKFLFRDLVKKIEGCQKEQPAKLQQAWATVVGEEVAQETLLEKVDAAKGLAVCRCLSSTLAFHIKRRKDLAEKLSEILGINIRRVIFK